MQTDYATYCPEDNKLRLYVGRVPRDEYLSLKAQGWTSTPKQDCDFVATWTPGRVATCLFYADMIEDEDQSPEDRAADRAERFSGYLDKRLGEAVGHADRYEAGPSAHGFQNEARAERMARRHDRIGERAADAWSKAEYWQSRTAGVISHALHKSSPGVRMGRIKEIETELRKREKDRAEWLATWEKWESASLMEDGEMKAKIVSFLGGSMGLYDFKHPRPETVTNGHIAASGSCLSTLLSMVENGYGSSDITPAEACEMFFARYPARPALETDWVLHLRLRLAYENQMLEAQGGRAAHIEMIPGGFLGGRQIQKVNKSTKTGRVVSVLVKDNKPSHVNHWGNPWPDGVAKVLSHTIETERLDPSAYRAPTDEELAAFLDAKKEAKKSAPKKESCPLINPTNDEAEKLQARLNAEALASHIESHARRYGKDYASEFKPSTVCYIKQATYSNASGGAYARAETRGLCKAAELEPAFSNCWSSSAKEAAERRGPALCKVRVTQSDGSDYGAKRVIVLTDKPQKALPVAVWEPAAEVVTA